MKTEKEIYARWYAKLKADPERWKEYRKRVNARLQKWRRENREKDRAISRRWREKHPEKMQEARRKWAEANPDNARARSLKYARANPEKIVEKSRAYARANPEKIRARTKRQYDADPVGAREKTRQWKKANPEKLRAQINRRRIRKAGIVGSHTEEEWQALCSYYMDQCLCCGEVPDVLTRDHVVPISQGGTDDIGNIQPLCKSCNSSKFTQTTDYRL